MESIGPDEVLVIEAREQDGAGTIGDILAMRAHRRGAAGVVTDGCVRDSPSLARMSLPVYARAPHAATLGRLHLPLDTNIPIACAGVLVMPGDLIVGDDEGAMVLPAALAEEVARDALEQEEREAFALERVTEGESIVGLYPLADHRVAEFEVWRAQREPPARPGPRLMLSPRIQSSVVSFTIDGEAETLEVWSDESALRALQVRHSRARFPSSCEQGLCGTCEVLVDGQPTRICLLAAARLDGTVIELPPRWTAAAP